MEKEGPQVCISGRTPSFPLKMVKIENYIYLLGKSFDPFSPFRERYYYVLGYLSYFLAGNRARSQVKGSESKFDISYFTHTIPGKLPVENVCSSTLQFCGYRSKTTFQKNFNVDFKGSTGFLDITPLNF